MNKKEFLKCEETFCTINILLAKTFGTKLNKKFHYKVNGSSSFI